MFVAVFVGVLVGVAVRAKVIISASPPPESFIEYHAEVFISGKYCTLARQ